MVHAQVTMLLVVNNALQGILSSFFFKYADTILKKYSSTLATIVTGIMSAALFGHSLTLNFLIGVTVVFISMHQFFSQGAFSTSLIAQTSLVLDWSIILADASRLHMNVGPSSDSTWTSPAKPLGPALTLP